jgi:hypothetical protein
MLRSTFSLLFLLIDCGSSTDLDPKLRLRQLQRTCQRIWIRNCDWDSCKGPVKGSGSETATETVAKDLSKDLDPKLRLRKLQRTCQLTSNNKMYRYPKVIVKCAKRIKSNSMFWRQKRSFCNADFLLRSPTVPNNVWLWVTAVRHTQTVRFPIHHQTILTLPLR